MLENTALEALMDNITTELIINEIKSTLPTDQNSWDILGFLNYNHDILAFGSDSKIIGRLFEIIIVPTLKQVAENLGCTLYESEQQTVYPDFWLEKPNGRLVAIDIKSTYRKFNMSGSVKNFNFTLGAFSSFLRNGTKNIARPYSQFDSHIVVGFLYTRNENATTGLSTLEDSNSITPAYEDVEVFVQEKYKIAGFRKGSGNTNNIGTISADSIDAFSNGDSYFADLGNDVFEDYWSHYPLYTDTKETKANLYTNLEEYFKWLEKDPSQIQKSLELQKIYTNWLNKNQNNSIR